MGAWSGPSFHVGKVVTIGDSFSSGTGIHDEGHEYDEEYGGATLDGWKFTPNSNGECWREKHLTPGPMYANDNHMSSIFLACKGAEVPQIMNQLDFLKYGGIPEVEWLSIRAHCGWERHSS